MIDIGANLASESFAQDLDDVILRATEAKVENIVITGSDFASNQAANNIVKRFPEITRSTAGLHPHYADTRNEVLKEQITSLIALQSVVAIGETGLDYNRNISSPKDQRISFSALLDIADSVDKPLFLHQRDAHSDFYAMLRERQALCQRSVVHCFTDTLESLEKYLELGTMIGITGWLCDKRRGENLRTIVSHIPIERLMIESDAPYLMPHREKIKKTMVKKNRNEPCTLLYVAEQLAECRNESVDYIIEKTSENATAFFKLNSH